MSNRAFSAGPQFAEIGRDDVIHIYANGQRIAREFEGNVTFEHHNPVTASWVTSHGHSTYRTTAREERDPRGAETPLSNPLAYAQSYVEWKFSQPLFVEGGDPFDYVSGYTKDGLPMTRSDLERILGKLGPTRFLALVDRYKIPEQALFNLMIGEYPLSKFRDGVGGAFLPEASSGKTRSRRHRPGANPQDPTPIPPEELGRIRSDVEKAISAKKCAEFLKTLLDEAAIQTNEPYRDIMVTFDNTQFFYGGTQGFGGLAPGSFEDGTARANLVQFEKNFISPDRSSFIRTQTAQNALGETLHHVGTHEAYDDAALASALNAIYVREGIDTPKTFSNKTLFEVSTASNYWHIPVMTMCSMKY
jgi:hypothetical protein